MTTASEARLVQTREGEKIEHRGLRSYEKKTITINREYDVFIGDVKIGQIIYQMFTRETRSKGNRYVNSRWQSPGWGYQEPGQWRTYEAYPSTRKDAIERLIRDAQRKGLIS